MNVIAEPLSSAVGAPPSVTATATAAADSVAAGLPDGEDDEDAARRAFIVRLAQHWRVCELEGRYEEAACAQRRAMELQLKRADEATRRLAAAQVSDFEALRAAHQLTCAAAEAEFGRRLRKWDAAAAAAVAALDAGHAAAMSGIVAEAEASVPTRARVSAAFLEQRRAEEALVRRGDYRAAHEVALGAAALYGGDAAATAAAHAASARLRLGRAAARHAAERGVVLQRAARGREELELARADEAARETARFRAAAAAAAAHHRREAACLERWAAAAVARLQRGAPLEADAPPQREWPAQIASGVL